MVAHFQSCPQVIVVVFMFVACAFAATSTNYYLNSTMIPNCYTSLNAGCSYTDPTLWNNGVVPTLFSSHVFLVSNVNDTTPVTLALTNTSILVVSLSISGPITLEIVDGGLAQVTNVTLESSAKLVVKAMSTAMFNGTVTVQDDSEIVLEEHAEYNQNAGWLRLDNTSSVIASNNSTLSLANGNISGQIVLDDYTVFNADGLYLRSDQVINARATLNKLNIKSINLNFTSGVTVNDFVSQSSNVIVDTHAHVTTGTVSLTGGSFEVLGTLTSQNFSTSLTTTATVYGTFLSPLISIQSTPLLVYGELDTGTLFVDGGNVNTQGLSATEMTVQGNAVINVANSFGISAKLNITNGSRLNLRSVSASINSSSLGRGDISINGSQIYFNTSYYLPNSKLTFVGACAVVAPTMSIFDFSYGDNPSVQVIALQGLTLNQSILFPGSLTVFGYLNAGGSIVTTGSISLTQATANVQGNFAPLGGLNMNSTVFNLAAGSNINTTTLYIGANSTFISLNPTNINAQVVNTGEIQMNANNPIAIVGKYTQMKTATLTLNKLNRKLPAMVTVVGTANIAGTLNYQPLVIASGETVKLPVIATTGGLTGKFIDPTRAFEKLIYESLNVYVQFAESGAETLLPMSWLVLVILLVSLL